MASKNELWPQPSAVYCPSGKAGFGVIAVVGLSDKETATHNADEEVVLVMLTCFVLLLLLRL